MKKDYRMLINNDTLEIVIENKIIRLTLIDREGPDISSKLLKEVYISNMVEAYDTPQFKLEADFYEVIDSFYHDEMIIWGVKEQNEIYWYFDKEVI